MTRRAQAGFALPLAIFFMAILTLLLTAAFAKVQGDRRVADSSGAAVSALAVAQSGLQTYLGSKTTRPPDGDSTRVNVTGGYADVVARIVDHMVDTMQNELYVVRSTGHVIDPTQGADPQASRTIAQFAQWRTAGALSTYPAVFTAANGLNDYDGTGTVTIGGADSVTCGAPTTGGLRVPNNAPKPGNAPPATGSPAFQDGNNSATVAGLVGVNWDSVEAKAFQPMYTTLTDLNSWSTYVIYGNATLTASGSGLLIVTDTLIVSGASITWAGVVLVGKAIVFNATNTRISGLLATGLDAELSGAAKATSPGSVGGNGKTQTIVFNSCNMRRAMQAVIGLAPIANGWVENWATY